MTRKSFLAILLVIAQLFCCLAFAGAEAPAEPQKIVTLTLKPQINTEALIRMLSSGSSDTPDADTVKMIDGLANNMTVSLVVSPEQAQGELFLKDLSLTSFAMQMNDDGMAVVADILPDYIFVMTKAEMEQATENAGQSANVQVDPQVISGVFTGLIGKIDAGFEAAYGEEETGSWTFAGTEFTSRKKIDMTTKEFFTLAVSSLRDVLSDPQLADLLAQVKVDPASLDDSLESIGKTPDEELPPFDAYRYINDAGDYYTTIVMDTLTTDPENGGNITANFGKAGSVFAVDALMASPIYNMSAALSSDTEAKTFDLAVDYAINPDYPYAQYMSGPSSFALKAAGTWSETGAAADISVNLSGVDLLSLHAEILFGGEITASFDTEGKTVLTVDSLNKLDEDSDEAQTLKAKMYTGLMKILSNASSIMPDEITQLMKLIMNSRK